MRTTMKLHYEKPAMKVYPLPAEPRILAGSLPLDGNPTGDQW